MRFISAGTTDVGRKRKVNQDSFQIDEAIGMFVVADGMGGHAGGEIASKTCAETIHQSLVEVRKAGLQSITAPDLVMGAVHRGNSAVFNKGSENPKLRGMGTTVDLMYFADEKINVGHVGDSRVYLARHHNIWQLTRDHSLVNEKFKAGLITREQMKTDQNKNVITRSVGFESSVLVDVYTREVQSGDVYLACSDGLSGLIDDGVMLAILDEFAFEKEELKKATELLIQRANEAGGDDNITVILVKIL